MFSHWHWHLDKKDAHGHQYDANAHKYDAHGHKYDAHGRKYNAYGVLFDSGVSYSKAIVRVSWVLMKVHN